MKSVILDLESNYGECKGWIDNEWVPSEVNIVTSFPSRKSYLLPERNLIQV